MKKIINTILFIIGLLFLIASISCILEKNIGASILGLIFTIGIFYIPMKDLLSIKNKEKRKLKSIIRSNNNKLQSRYNSEDVDMENNWIKKNRYFYINESLKKVRINTREYNFSDIIDFELLIDGSSISKAQLGSTIGKTLLFGSIIGGTTSKRKNINYCTQLQIKVTVNNLSNPTEYINFMTGFSKLNKNSYVYQKASENANDCLSILTIITKRNNE